MERDPFPEEKLDEIRREFPTLKFFFEHDVLSVSHPLEMDLLSLVITNNGWIGYLRILNLSHYVEDPSLYDIRQFLYGIETIVLYRAGIPVAWQQWFSEEQKTEWILQTSFRHGDPYDYQTWGDEVYTKATVRIVWSGGDPGKGDPKIVTSEHEHVGALPAKDARKILENIKPFDWFFDKGTEDGKGNRWITLALRFYEMLLPIEWREIFHSDLSGGSYGETLSYGCEGTNQLLEFSRIISHRQDSEDRNIVREIPAIVEEGDLRRIDEWRILRIENGKLLSMVVKLNSAVDEWEDMAEFLREHLPLIRLRSED